MQRPRLGPLLLCVARSEFGYFTGRRFLSGNRFSSALLVGRGLAPMAAAALLAALPARIILPAVLMPPCCPPLQDCFGRRVESFLWITRSKVKPRTQMSV